jgi:hypothetical protein
VPCLARPRAHPDVDSQSYDRHNQVQSDSLWLINRLRREYPDRLAAAYVAAPTDPDGLRLVVRLTGDEPIPPMRLADRARKVPVVVEYGARHSLGDVEAIRQRVHARVVALLPGLQGVGHDERSGTIQLDVHAPDAGAKDQVLGQCSALRTLYDMPVEIEFTPAAFDLTAAG